MFKKMDTLILSILFFMFLFVNIKNVQLTKLSNGSLQKQWPKTASFQQALRQIRGFRPEALSTARGFGKRANFNNILPFNSLSNIYDLQEKQIKQDVNENEMKEYLKNIYNKDTFYRYFMDYLQNKKENMVTEENSKKTNEDENDVLEN